MSRQRADVLLVARGLCESRAQAQAAIAAGLVTANGQLVRKASEGVPGNAIVTAEKPHPFVSRGGVKLVAALDAFAIDPAGLACLDVGSSTGGFTDALLQRGAAHVTAIDTGTGQMHERLRGRREIALHESTDVRQFDPNLLGMRPQLAVIDVSFISVTKVLPAVSALVAERAALIALIKPQFEVGKGALAKGGLVKDEAARQGAVAAVCAALDELGWATSPVMDSPLTGGDGNCEYLVSATR